MDSESFDLEQRRNWNALALAWERWGDAFERGAGAVSRKLLDLAALTPGCRVLDVATGLGEPALTAAKLVAPGGHVTGIDIAEEMIAVARRRQGKVANVAFLAMDAQAYIPDRRYDVVLSRFGLMFMPRWQQFLRSLPDHMQPQGRVVFSTWSTPDAVPMISLAVGFFARELGLPPPPPGKPNPFSMANGEAVLSELEALGFSQRVCEPVMAPFRFDTLDEFIQFSRDLIPPSIGKAISEHASQERIEGLWEKFAGVAGRYVQADGQVHLPSRALCFVAKV